MWPESKCDGCPIGDGRRCHNQRVRHPPLCRPEYRAFVLRRTAEDEAGLADGSPGSVPPGPGPGPAPASAPAVALGPCVHRAPNPATPCPRCFLCALGLGVDGRVDVGICLSCARIQPPPDGSPSP